MTACPNTTAMSHLRRCSPISRWLALEYFTRLWSVIGILLASTLAVAETPLVVTVRTPESTVDQRLNYETALLELALEKTREAFGPYKLQPGYAMNLPRAISMARNNEVENLFFKTSYSTALNREFAHPPYPLDRGVLGYRVCFVHSALAEEVSKIQSLNQLRQYTIGQGSGWLDVDILRHNGFTVIESDNYANLFLMLSAGRIDLFCRGVTEVQNEWQAHKDLPGLSLNNSFALYYPLPRFFWTHKNNQLALQRISRGLQLALADGSADKLWQKHHGRYLDFVQLPQRHIFTLENPNLEGIESDFEEHFFRPETKKSDR